MGTNVRRHRSTEEISKLSAQTRLTAWTAYKELMRSGVDSATALRKALRDACPPKEDPYYRTFYANKMRELELWRKLALWPLSKPKDIEHDTGPHTAMEVATKMMGRVFGDEEGASGFTLLLDTDEPDDEEHIDTLEFDPVEVAKIIDSYELDGTLFSTEMTEPSDAALPHQTGLEGGQTQCPHRLFFLEPASMEQDRASSWSELRSSGSPQAIPVSAHCATGPYQAAGPDVMNHVEFDQETLNELLAMVAWWKRNKKDLMDRGTQASSRPHFARNNLRTKRITMNAKLWEDAEAAAKQQPDISGGTLSGLLEYLLWRHLGAHEKYVKE